MNKRLAEKINKMAKEDQGIRKNFKKGTHLNPEVDKKNTFELKKIIKEYGWPTIPLVGKKASFNAWLLAQHSDHDRSFQKYALKLLKKHLKMNEIDQSNIAYLTDRLLVAKNKKQIFGTQFKFNKTGGLKLNPIKNIKGVNALRKKYNLPPIEKYLEMAKEFNSQNRKK